MSEAQLIAIMAAVLRSGDVMLPHAGAVAEAVSIYRLAREQFEVPPMKFPTWKEQL